MRTYSCRSFRNRRIDPGWRTAAVLGLVRAARTANDFTLLPLVADALDDAGCTDAALLAHCRHAVQHSPRCAVLGALLPSEPPARLSSRVVSLAECRLGQILGYGGLGVGVFLIRMALAGPRH